MAAGDRRTDDELLGADVGARLAAAVAAGGAPPGEATVAAAVAADRAGVRPRSLTFLAEVVRRGGVAYAAGLAEPLPTPEQSTVVRAWLVAAAAAAVPATPAGADDIVARWLDAVAVVLDARQSVSRGPRSAR